MVIFTVDHGVKRLVTAAFDLPGRDQAGVYRVAELCDDDEVFDCALRGLELNHLVGIIGDVQDELYDEVVTNGWFERRPDAIAFAVADTGRGIPPEVQGRVFDWFQTHSRGSGHRGAGLGLSIVRSFVELHGGTVTLQSAVGEGTTVICRFPLEQHVERTAA